MNCNYSYTNLCADNCSENMKIHAQMHCSEHELAIVNTDVNLAIEVEMNILKKIR